MATILTQPGDYDAVRAYLGVDKTTVSDAALANFTLGGLAEVVITKLIKAQAANGVASVATIMAYNKQHPNYDDRTLLKAATAEYTAYLFTHGSTNAINTSVTSGDQTIDLGGIGVQWIEQGEKAYALVGYNLSLITNWPEITTTTMLIGGPSSNGRGAAGTISGFFIS